MNNFTKHLIFCIIASSIIVPVDAMQRKFSTFKKFNNFAQFKKTSIKPNFTKSPPGQFKFDKNRYQKLLTPPKKPFCLPRRTTLPALVGLKKIPFTDHRTFCSPRDPLNGFLNGYHPVLNGDKSKIDEILKSSREFSPRSFLLGYLLHKELTSFSHDNNDINTLLELIKHFDNDNNDSGDNN
ncbi:MAG: hypothetical protein AB7R69_02415 [Candidatus Babeliales bacterium]